MKTGVEFRICLPYAEVSPEQVTALCSELLLFEPVIFQPTFAAKHDTGMDFPGFLGKLQKDLAEHAADIDMTTYGGSDLEGVSNMLEIRFVGAADLLRIRLETTAEIYDTVQEIAHRFIASHPVISAALYRRAEDSWNYYYSFCRWETLEINESIEKARAEHPELTEIVTFPSSGIRKHRCIDNRQFPGYTQEVLGIWFGCRHEMWFGKAYDKYIPLDLLSQFTECTKNETLGNGTVHIVMYDAPEQFCKPESAKRAFAFRALTDYVSRANRWAESKG